MALLDGLARVSFNSHASDLQAIVNTFHISNVGAGAPPDEPTLAALASELATQFSTTYRAILSSSATFDTIVVKQVSDGLAADVLLEATFAVNLAGTRTDGSGRIPEGICGCLALKTPNASRKFRGHLLLPPCRQASAVNENALDPTDAYSVAAEAFAAEMAKGTPGGSGWSGTHLGDYGLVVFSRTAAFASQPSVANVQTLVLRPKASFLRRRERGSS